MGPSVRGTMAEGADETADGSGGRARGTPQGGVVSPLLANLFCTTRSISIRGTAQRPVCRYADDAVIHCKSKRQAE